MNFLLDAINVYITETRAATYVFCYRGFFIRTQLKFTDTHP